LRHYEFRRLLCCCNIIGNLRMECSSISYLISRKLSTKLYTQNNNSITNKNKNQNPITINKQPKYSKIINTIYPNNLIINKMRTLINLIMMAKMRMKSIIKIFNTITLKMRLKSKEKSFSKSPYRKSHYSKRYLNLTIW
jgi:hypothetical protein